eukprot:12429308-Karenia_brevis.AAC.1
MLRLLSSRLETLEELQDPDDPRLISIQAGGLSNAQLWDHLMDLDQNFRRSSRRNRDRSRSRSRRN